MRRTDHFLLAAGLHKELGIKREDPKQGRHPRSGYRVNVGIEHREPIAGSSPPMRQVVDHGHIVNGVDKRKNWGMNPEPVGTVPVKHVYRAVSEVDYQGILQRGHMQSDARGNVADGEGTCTSHSAAAARYYGETFGAGSGQAHPYRILKIAVKPEHEWRVDPRDGYIKSPHPIPAEHIVRATRTIQPERRVPPSRR